MNKSVEEIIKLYEEIRAKESEIRNSIRCYLSRHLMDTSETNKIEVNFVVEPENTFGLSSLLLPEIRFMWQDPCEGWITCEMDSGRKVDIDDFDLYELQQIVKDFDYFIVNKKK